MMIISFRLDKKICWSTDVNLFTITLFNYSECERKTNNTRYLMWIHRYFMNYLYGFVEQLDKPVLGIQQLFECMH